MHARRWLVSALLTVVTLAPTAFLQEKGGEEETGPYEVVANWPQPIPGLEDLTWGSTAGVFAETPDRVWIAQRGMLPKPPPRQPGQGGGGDARRATSGEPKWTHCIIVVDRNGKLVQAWTQHDPMFATKGGRGPHKIKMSPYDPEKHVWVIDDQLHQIFKFSYDGKLVMTLGERLVEGADANHFARPTDIDWLPDGTFFISDGYTGTRVAKFDKNGKFLMQWGEKGESGKETRPGYMNTVHSVAVGKDRRVYVSDRSNSRVQVFDENGKFLDAWPGIRSPYSVFMAKDQYLWVTDGVTNKILKYDLKGKLLYGWGTYGQFPGGLWGVHQISVDQEGNLYTAEVFNGKAQKFRPKKGADPSKLVGQELRYQTTSTY
jgi:DNA-binding beta-propeller fold protein YncE